MRCSFQRDAAEQTIVLRRQQGADGVEQLVDRAERPVLHGEFFALLRKILLERDEVQGLQRPAAAADADLVLERLHQPGLRLCMAHERVLLADSLEEGLLHGLFGVGGIEKEVLGVYVSGHPLMEYEAALSALTPCIELAEADGSGAIHDNQTVTAGGIIGSLRTRAVKSGAGLMAYAVLEDMSGSIEIAAFPSIYQKYASLIANDKCVAVRGRFSMREDRDNSILIDEIVPLQKGSKNAGEKRLALNFLSDALHLRNAAVELLHRFPGNTEVLFRDAATGKVLLAPRHCCVNCAEELLFELKRMLGEENVKIVRKK